MHRAWMWLAARMRAATRYSAGSLADSQKVGRNSWNRVDWSGEVEGWFAIQSLDFFCSSVKALLWCAHRTLLYVPWFSGLTNVVPDLSSRSQSQSVQAISGCFFVPHTSYRFNFCVGGWARCSGTQPWPAYQWRVFGLRSLFFVLPRAKTNHLCLPPTSEAF